MPRPHEDLERHTLVDHRAGGPAIAFARGDWCAIDIAHVQAARADAGVSAYETLIERARSSAAAVHPAAILRAVSGRRVVVLAGLAGNDGFRHLRAAWDDHHLYAEHRAVAESASLALYRVAATAGDAEIVPASHDAYGFERIERDLTPLAETIASALSAADGFRGAAIFGTSDATGAALLYRFEHAPQIDAFRASAGAAAILGSVGATGESSFAVHPVKTFG